MQANDFVLYHLHKLALELKYSDDQPRDEHGRWVSTGAPSDNSDGLDIPAFLQRDKDNKLPSDKEKDFPIPFSKHGEIDQKSEQHFRDQFLTLPSQVLGALKEFGTTLAVGKNLIDIFPDLKGVHPRGWPAGWTWNSAEGIYRGTRSTKVIGAATQTTFKGEVRPGRDGVIFHETGHAYDHALGVVSRNSATFDAAYKADLKELRASMRADSTGRLAGQTAYYRQQGYAGKSEAFAELFGANHDSRGRAAAPIDIRPHFPRTNELVQKAIRDGGWKRDDRGFPV